MPQTPDNINVLNYPIETEEAKRFWASEHKCNEALAIICFSLDLENANDNLRRYGYKYFWRKKALENFGAYVNHPTMYGVQFFDPNIPYWFCIPQGGPYYQHLCTEDGITLCTEDWQPLLIEYSTAVEYLMTEGFDFIVTEDMQKLIA